MGLRDKKWITPRELYERALEDQFDLRQNEQENDPQSKLERLTPTKIYQWLTRELGSEYRSPIVDFLFCSDRAWTRYGEDVLHKLYLGSLDKFWAKEEIASLNAKIPSIQSIFNKGKISATKANRFLKKHHKSGRCNSLWCSACRERATQNYHSKIQEHLEFDRTIVSYSYGQPVYSYGQPEYDPKDYYHITGTLGVTEIDHTKIQEMIDNDGKIWRKIRRYIGNESNFEPHTNPWIEVVYEYELVNWRLLQHSKTKSPQKVKECEQLRGRDNVRSAYMFYVHFHALTNIPKSRHSEVFKKYYWLDENQTIYNKNDVGLYVQKVRGSNVVEWGNSWKKLTSYPFKNPTRFKHSFVGNDFTNGEKFNSEELSWIFSLYENVQGVGFKSLRRSVYSDRFRDEIWRAREYTKLNLDRDKTCIGMFSTAIHMDRVKEGREWFFHPHYPKLRIPIYKNIYGRESYSITRYPTFIPFNKRDWNWESRPENLPDLSENGWNENFSVWSDENVKNYKIYPNRNAAKNLFNKCKKNTVIDGPVHYVYLADDDKPYWDEETLLYLINGRWKTKNYLDRILKEGMKLKDDDLNNLKEKLSKTFYEKGVPHIKYDWGEEEGDDFDVIEEFIK